MKVASSSHVRSLATLLADLMLTQCSYRSSLHQQHLNTHEDDCPCIVMSMDGSRRRRCRDIQADMPERGYRRVCIPKARSTPD